MNLIFVAVLSVSDNGWIPAPDDTFSDSSFHWKVAMLAVTFRKLVATDNECGF
jgi:hypothetical protein